MSAASAEPAGPEGEQPPSRIDALLESARSALGGRLTPREAADAQREGALLVDIRYAALRDRDGTVPGALIVERNELEWRLDPTCAYRSPEATGSDLRIVVLCNEGYASSLAARSLRELGLHRATDLAGGFQAWRAAGLPLLPPVRPAEDDPPTLEP
ncbi:Rhodanese-related sulfurtransferase [Streptomyces sp. WMMB 714]|uniref:rhodanese-like domain-containing protein n=1 Tax=Streptomyces sp. WMMB 714 TaxID=1286822 RepID=UPI0005F78C71|nr:rhodanese-like domain-containing protein [Streptomyces sp. WMMB 714]SCK45296.1 Rhodanese-related sulfurtransferase [Streptomyces sp. WMMB 714]